MSFTRSISLFVIMLLVAGPAWARPRHETMPKVQALDLSGRASDVSAASGTAMRAAVAGTTFYGGTFWAADSQRWEAYQGQLWTFDSGVGSSIVPVGGPQNLSQPTASWVNPFKQPGLHATMEGWIGVDESYSNLGYFRRVASSDPRFTSATKCVGSAGGLGGSYSFWCGEFPGEADALCFGTGQGYGNLWNICIQHSFTYGGGNATLGFQYKNETEDGFDYSFVYVDTTGNGNDVEVASYTGVVSGTASITLAPGSQLPRVAKPIKIRFCVATDGAWSDEDGLFPTACGAFAVDNISITGAITHAADFETSDNGWTLSPHRPGLGGEWANIYHVNDLPPTMLPCACALYDSVLALFDDHNGHNNYAYNMAVSPWVDLKAYGAVGTPGKIIKTNIYYALPLRDYIFLDFKAQYYPYKCTKTGKLITSPWVENGFTYGFPPVSQCTSTLPGTTGTEIDLSGFIPPGAEEVRIAVGILSYCRFFANCTQTSNTSPWFDEIGLGVYGGSSLPFIFAESNNRAQDNFPKNGTLNLYATGRVDANNVEGDFQPEIGTTLGDTMVVNGAVGNAEVYVHFRVTPGPGTHPSRFSAWYQKHAVSNVEAGFRMARMDTAEYGNSGPLTGSWMTTYHEADPNFWISDRTLDPNDLAPNGGMWRLDNDIFPDDLFTAGTRLDYFFTANNVGQTNYVRQPDPGYYEMEILPSSMTASSTWNCVLYVDHSDRKGQRFIETALTGLLGTGSENAETTNWDRYDVNAASAQQASFGRPLQTEYGATLAQTFAYRTILWDSGNLNAFNLTKEDADVLLPWLTLNGLGQHNLYLSGDGIVFSPISEEASEPSARKLIQEVAGVGILSNCSTGTYRNANCPTSGAPQDLTACVNLDPVSGSLVANHPARGVGHQGEGNGCPELRSFDVLSLLTPQAGTVTGDERYASAIKSANYASAATNVAGRYKIVADGVAVSERRDSGTACDYLLGGTASVAGRLNEVLTYFGYPVGLCSDPTIGVGIPNQEPLAVVRTQLKDISPNPLGAGRIGRIQFTMAKGGSAKVEVFNLEGRIVQKLFDGPAQPGVNETSWNGTDTGGQKVASGVYYVRLRTAQEDLSRRVVVLKTP
jgi:hypothetical protein